MLDTDGLLDALAEALRLLLLLPLRDPVGLPLLVTEAEELLLLEMLPLLLAAALRVRDPDTVARADLLLVPAWSPLPAPVLGLGLPLGLLLRLGLPEEVTEALEERLPLPEGEELL